RSRSPPFPSTTLFRSGKAPSLPRPPRRPKPSTRAGSPPRTAGVARRAGSPNTSLDDHNLVASFRTDEAGREPAHDRDDEPPEQRSEEHTSELQSRENL